MGLTPIKGLEPSGSIDHMVDICFLLSIYAEISGGVPKNMLIS